MSLSRLTFSVELSAFDRKKPSCWCPHSANSYISKIYLAVYKYWLETQKIKINTHFKVWK